MISNGISNSYGRLLGITLSQDNNFHVSVNL